MHRCTRWICVAVAGAGLLYPATAHAQDTPAAKATREKVKKTVIDEVDWKDAMTREIFADIKREAGDKVIFYIDNTSGMSNNTRMSLSAKKVTIEKVLNDLADKNDFGWFVMSDKKDKKDGQIILRKSKFKERGYFEGKEPKASLPAERFYAYSMPATSTWMAIQGLRVAGVFIRQD